MPRLSRVMVFEWCVEEEEEGATVAGLGVLPACFRRCSSPPPPPPLFFEEEEAGVRWEDFVRCGDIECFRLCLVEAEEGEEA